MVFNRMLKTVAPLLFLAAGAFAQEFREIPATLTPLGSQVGEPAFVDTGDFDHDGDLDLMVFGDDNPGMSQVLKVYRNNGGTYSLFQDFNLELGDSLFSSAAAWADLDKDNNYEILVRLHIPSNDSSKVRFYTYDPAQNRFRPKTFSLTVGGILWNSVARFADYNNDGFPDLIISGTRQVNTAADMLPFSRIWRNNNGTGFVNINAPLTAVQNPVIAWKDIDGDNDLDLFLSGSFVDASLNIVNSAKVYKFNGTNFTEFFALPTTYLVNSASWGEYD